MLISTLDLLTMAKGKTTKDFLPTADSESELDYSDATASKYLVNAPLDDEADFESDEEEERVFQTKGKSARKDFGEDEDEELADEDDVSNEEDTKPSKKDETKNVVSEQNKRSKKLKKLTPEQLAKEQKKIKKTGVCYLSSIPPYMKPVKLRSVLSRFGKLDRIFLKPEDEASYKKRVKYGGNKKRKFTEGWIEFVNKKEAKLCAETMNGNILGGKKSSYYHDDIINIKYLSGFKWFDLTQQIAKENEIRQAKLTMEISQQQKLNKTFVNNVERSRREQRKRKAEGEKDDKEDKGLFQREFDQRDITSTRHDAKPQFKKAKNSDNLDSVLSKVF